MVGKQNAFLTERTYYWGRELSMSYTNYIHSFLHGMTYIYKFSMKKGQLKGKVWVSRGGKEDMSFKTVGAKLKGRGHSYGWLNVWQEPTHIVKQLSLSLKKIAITCSKVKSIAGGWRIGCKIAGDEVISRVWHKIAGGVEIVPRWNRGQIQETRHTHWANLRDKKRRWAYSLRECERWKKGDNLSTITKKEWWGLGACGYL